MTTTVYPRSVLLIHSGSPIIVSSGPHIQTIDPNTGNVLHTTQNASKAIQESLKKSGPIRSAILDPTATHLVTLADDKLLKVWKVDGLEFLHERDLPKRPTGALFTEDGQTIVVADKFGDVFSYPLHPPPESEPKAKPEAKEQEHKEKRAEAEPQTSVELQSESTSTPVQEPEPALEPSTSSTPAPSDPSQPAQPTELNTSTKKRRRRKHKPNAKPENPPVPRNSLVSHASTSGGTLILGHTSLLTAFLLAKDDKGLSYVITADRDEHIRVSWYPKGYVIEAFCLGCTQFISALHIPSFAPSILISGGGDKSLMVWDWLSGKLISEIPIWEKVEAYIGVKVRPYKRKENGNEKKTREREGTEASESKDEDEKMKDVEQENGKQEEDVEMAEEGKLAGEEVEEEKVLVVQKVSSLETEDGRRWILFSAVGGTAVFLTPYQPSEGSTSLIECIDLGKPLLDFAVDSQGLIWACVDANWNPEVVSEAVRLLKVQDGKLIIENTPPESTHAKTLSTLNGNLVLATPEQISSLDFYSSLKALPKRGGDEDGEGGDGDGPAGPVPKYTRPRQGPNGGKKEKGKLKSKQAVRKALEDGEGGGEEDRQPKKQKSETDSTSVDE